MYRMWKSFQNTVASAIVLVVRVVFRDLAVCNGSSVEDDSYSYHHCILLPWTSNRITPTPTHLLSYHPDDNTLKSIEFDACTQFIHHTLNHPFRPQQNTEVISSDCENDSCLRSNVFAYVLLCCRKISSIQLLFVCNFCVFA